MSFLKNFCPQLRKWLPQINFIEDETWEQRYENMSQTSWIFSSCLRVTHGVTYPHNKMEIQMIDYSLEVASN